MNPELKQMLVKIQQDLNTLIDKSDTLQNDITVIKDHQQRQESKIKYIETSIGKSNQRLARIEKTEREKNIILFKLNETENINTNLFACILEILEETGVKIPEVCIVDVFRLGKFIEGRKRPVLIKLTAPRFKKLFFEKNEEFQKCNLVVASDLSPEERMEAKKLLKVRYILRNKGQDTVLRNNNKLLRNNEVISNDEINAILEEYEKQKMSTTSSTINAQRGGQSLLKEALASEPSQKESKANKRTAYNNSSSSEKKTPNLLNSTKPSFIEEIIENSSSSPNQKKTTSTEFSFIEEILGNSSKSSNKKKTTSTEFSFIEEILGNSSNSSNKIKARNTKLNFINEILGNT